MGGGFPPYKHGHQGFDKNLGPFANSSWQPSASNNPCYFFTMGTQVGNSNSTSWNSKPPLRLPFLETLKLLDL
jgi:hypothetical protein